MNSVATFKDNWLFLPPWAIDYLHKLDARNTQNV